MDKLKPVWKEVEDIIKKSPVPEDPIHAENTLYWLLKLYPEADENLKLAAFAHDIERAIPEKKVKREDFSDYDSFKAAHARNSAKIIGQIMKKHNLCDKRIKDIKYLVLHHETGGCERSNLIKDADALSFFDTNLAFYIKRNTMEDVIHRCIWGYKRLSPDKRKLLFEIMKNKKETKSIIEEAISRYKKLGHE